VVNCQIQRQPTTHRISQQVRRHTGLLIYKLGQIRCNLLHPVARRISRRTCLTVTGQINSQDPEGFSQNRSMWLPVFRRPGEAVQQQHRRPTAAEFVVIAHALDLSKWHQVLSTNKSLTAARETLPDAVWGSASTSSTRRGSLLPASRSRPTAVHSASVNAATSPTL